MKSKAAKERVEATREAGRNYFTFENEFDNAAARECSDSPEREIERYKDMQSSAKRAVEYIEKIRLRDIEPNLKELLAYRLHNFNEFYVSLGELIKQAKISIEFSDKQSSFVNQYISGLRFLTFDLTGSQKEIDDQWKKINEKLETRIKQIDGLFQIRNTQIEEIYAWRDAYIELHNLKIPKHGMHNDAGDDNSE